MLGLPDRAHVRGCMIVADKKRKILVVTKQKSGRRHDKRLADKEDIFTKLPKDVAAWADTAFTGEEKNHKNVHIPKKKPTKSYLPTV